MREIFNHIHTPQRLAALFGASVIMGLSAMPAHAAGNAQSDITIRMDVSQIQTESDRLAAIATFKNKAENACETPGARSLRTKAYEKACVSDLVDRFEVKLDQRLATRFVERTTASRRIG